jgi:hypothetical protein
LVIREDFFGGRPAFHSLFFVVKTETGEIVPVWLWKPLSIVLA